MPSNWRQRVVTWSHISSNNQRGGYRKSDMPFQISVKFRIKSWKCLVSKPQWTPCWTSAWPSPGTWPAGISPSPLASPPSTSISNSTPWMKGSPTPWKLRRKRRLAPKLPNPLPHRVMHPTKGLGVYQGVEFGQESYRFKDERSCCTIKYLEPKK